MEDTYKTITEPSEGIYTEKRSKFIAIALPVRTHEEIKAHLEVYQKKYTMHVTFVMPICWVMNAKIFVQMIMENLPVQPANRF